MTLLLWFVEDDKGTTAIEYALIAVGISVAILASVKLVGSDVSALYDRIAGVVASCCALKQMRDYQRPG